MKILWKRDMVMSHPLFLIHHKSRISHGQLPSPIVSPTWLLLVGRGNVQLPLSFVFFGKKKRKTTGMGWCPTLGRIVYQQVGTALNAVILSAVY
jgi:hypothetical protein